MADRAVIGKPIGPEERWHVAAYLVAISPDLQQGLAAKRQQDLESQSAIDAVRNLSGGAACDMEASKKTFERKCVQCHALPMVTAASAADVKALVSRMAGNGLVATPDEFAQIVFYLSANVKASLTSNPVAFHTTSTKRGFTQ
jgi:hypothetical protein